MNTNGIHSLEAADRTKPAAEVSAPTPSQNAPVASGDLLALTAKLAEVLAAAVAASTPVRLDLDDGGLSLRLSIGAALANNPPPRPVALPAFSPTEQRILDAVAPEGWTTTSTIAQRIGESIDGDLPAVLRNLTERGALESAQGKGFRLARAEQGGRPATLEPAWPAFSPVEQSIVKIMPTTGWMTTETLAAKIGESPTSDLKAILRNLVARGVLESAQGNGFRLAKRKQTSAGTVKPSDLDVPAPVKPIVAGIPRKNTEPDDDPAAIVAAAGAKVLDVLNHACRPMSRAELAKALRIDRDVFPPDTLDDALAALENSGEVDARDGRFSLAKGKPE
jgi:DNA-binding IscR family transcriptional regulator